MSSEPFTLVYDGPALRDGKMDARDLSYALLALGDSVSRTNYLLNGENASVKLRITAADETGSFPAILELFQDLQQQGLIGAEIVPPRDILEHLGLVTASVISSEHVVIRNLIDLWKLLKGDKPEVTSKDSETNTATITVDGKDNHVDLTVLNIYGDVQIHTHFPRIFSPLRTRDVDTLEVIHRGESVRKVTDTEAKDITPGRWQEETTGERTDEIRAEIITAQFREGYKWRFFSSFLGTFTANMRDKTFLSDLQTKKGRFGYGDWLHFEMRTRVMETEEEKTVERDIIKVFDRTPAPRQAELGD